MNQRVIQPYLFFNGRCEEALEFYQSALGAVVDMQMRFREAPESPPPGSIPEGWEDKIMHASFRVGESVLMASDGCQSGAAFGGFGLSIAAADAADADRVFAALAEGGQVTMPMGETFWSPRFGSVTDRFGISWMVGVFPVDSQ